MEVNAFVRRKQGLKRLWFERRRVYLGPECVVLSNDENSRWIVAPTQFVALRHEFNSDVCTIRFPSKAEFADACRAVSRTPTSLSVQI